MDVLELAVRAGLIQPVKVGELIVSPALSHDYYGEPKFIIPFSKSAIVAFIRKATGREDMPEGDCMVAFRMYVKAQCRMSLKAKDGKAVVKMLEIY